MFLIMDVILIVIIIWKSLMASLKRYIVVSSRLLTQTHAFTHPRVSFIARTQRVSLAHNGPLSSIRFRH